MDDARELQYGVGFETSDADSSIEQLTQKVDELEQKLGAVEMGAQKFGAGTVSACTAARNGAAAFSDAADDAAAAAQNVGNATSAAEKTTRQFGSGLDDAGDDTDAFRAQIRKTAQEAENLGDAFKQTMADGLEAGKSIAKSFGTGITGAIDFSTNKVKGFAKAFETGAKKIGTAFRHPIKTIRNNLVEALRKAKKGEQETGDEANDAEQDLEDMGDAGEEAGNKVSEALGSVIKKFVGFEAIKKATELLVKFGEAALNAFAAGENTAKKFDALFTSDAAEWVENYSDAVHRSEDEVKSFMVSNQAMYKNLGITSEAAQDLSEITTSLAYDFGNAFNMEDAEALSVIQSAIGGDTAALTEYGIMLDETALKQSAAALGLGENIDSLDDAAAAQVRLNAILMQSEAIQEAAITQTDGLVNSTKSLKGIFNDFLSTAGSKFAPAVETVVDSVVDSWPTLEPMLLSFVDVLADGLAGVAPVLVELGQNLIPALTTVLGTVASAAGPLLQIFGDLAGTILPPLADIISQLVSYALPPLIEIFNVLNQDVIQPLMPVIEQVSGQILPVLGQAFSAVGSIVGELAGAVMPPLCEIIGILADALGPIIDIGSNLISAILPTAQTLIGALSTVLSGVVLPIIEALSPLLEIVADVLGTVVGWVSDLIGFFANGVSKVANFFAGIFGGAKDSSDAVDDLTGAVSGLDDAAGTETSLAIDTSEYSASVSAATQDAQDAMTEAATAAREIGNENYTAMADDAETAYARMTLDAEDAWTRMTTAAEDGTAKICAAFTRIATAAQSVSNANISVTGVNIPGNADGTPSFAGGWTRMNEEGGELAFLPQGTAIIPADKTDQIINNSTSSESASFQDHSTFSPQISITLTGETAAPDAAESIADKVRELMEQFWEEKKEQEYHHRAMQGGFAR